MGASAAITTTPNFRTFLARAQFSSSFDYINPGTSAGVYSTLFLIPKQSNHQMRPLPNPSTIPTRQARAPRSIKVCPKAHSGPRAVDGLPAVHEVSATVRRIDGLPIRQPAPAKTKTSSRALPVNSNWYALNLAEKAALYDVLGEVGNASGSVVKDPPAFTIRRLLVLSSVGLVA